MHINKAELRKLKLPLKKPFTTSFGTIATKETVIVKLYSGNTAGYGEASSFHAPIYNEETVDTCMYVLEKFLIPMTIGKNFKTTTELMSIFDNIVGHRIARSSIDFAFSNLLATNNLTSLKSLYGGVQNKIEVGESVGIHDTITETLREVESALSRGFTRIKLKIKPRHDVKLVAAVRKQWPDVDLMVDGNSAYTLDRDIDALQKLDTFDLTMIEQPLAHDDLVDHASLQRQIKTPICLDESIKSFEDARKALQIGSCKIINIKPGRVGGSSEAIKIHNYCYKRNIPVWCGGLLETGIGRAFNIAIASLPGFTLPADMSPVSDFYGGDLVKNSFSINSDGTIDVSNEAGLGYEIDEAAIDKYTTQKIEIS